MEEEEDFAELGGGGCGNYIYNLGSFVTNFLQIRGRGGSGGGGAAWLGRRTHKALSFNFLNAVRCFWKLGNFWGKKVLLSFINPFDLQL